MSRGVVKAVAMIAIGVTLVWLSQNLPAEQPSNSASVTDLPKVSSDMFVKSFGKNSTYANPKFILRLSNGFVIGFDEWEINRRQRILRLYNCAVVSGNGTRQKVAICSEAGIVSVKDAAHDFQLTHPNFGELIVSIKFRDGSQFVFPNVGESAPTERQNADR